MRFHKTEPDAHQRIGGAVAHGGARWSAGREREDAFEVTERDEVLQVRRQRRCTQPDRTGDRALAALAERDRLENVGGLLHLGQFLPKEKVRSALEEPVEGEEAGCGVLQYRARRVELSEVGGDAAADEVGPGLLLAGPARVKLRGFMEAERFDPQIGRAPAVERRTRTQLLTLHEADE